MKKHVSNFVFRGLVAAGFGPIVLAIIFGILGAAGTVTALAPSEVCLGILSITLMAFIAGAITGIYQVESLPLPSAILIHGGVLYLDYLIMYLINDWIPHNAAAIGTFSTVFVLGFAAVWACIYLHSRKKTAQLNQKLHADRR